MPTVLFYVFAAAAVITAFMVICSRNAVYSALYLIGTLFSLACIFLLLHAEFIAAIQVLVYAGAIMVLFLFVIMLLNVGRERRVPIKLKGQKVAALLFSLGLLAVLFIGTRGVSNPDPIGPFSPEKVAEMGNVKSIGWLLFTDYLFPFEVTSVLLFVAIVGAVVLARRNP
ncbi:MAG: NADH-quinone oxidoreductase subunit J [Nitrospinota bacterium]